MSYKHYWEPGLTHKAVEECTDPKQLYAWAAACDIEPANEQVCPSCAAYVRANNLGDEYRAEQRREQLEAAVMELFDGEELEGKTTDEMSVIIVRALLGAGMEMGTEPS